MLSLVVLICLTIRIPVFKLLFRHAVIWYYIVAVFLNQTLDTMHNPGEGVWIFIIGFLAIMGVFLFSTAVVVDSLPHNATVPPTASLWLLYQPCACNPTVPLQQPTVLL